MGQFKLFDDVETFFLKYIFRNISAVSSNKIEILFIDHVVQSEHFFQH